MGKLPLVLAGGVVLLGACSSPEHASSVPGTTPAIWTGSPSPSAAQASEPGAATAPSIITHLKAPDGTQVATAAFEFNNGYATITVETTADGVLTPGFHDMHIHQVGKCEPNSVAPTGGPPGDFLSAGDHFQAPGHTGEPASGALPSLQIRKDGSGALMTTTDAFAMQDLLTGQKTAIIIHAGAANFANAASGSNNQTSGTPGPNGMTMNTGDAGKRVACGVIGAG
ncbi:superoxide dismutase[Cu-Zn] [Mycobacterium sp. M23085]|uniref:superoxide dismutase[Cu-Zn] n=1 Tax=Mycobacterium sp. M23085 TaxID=3378087 RepID=UPI0038782E03